MTKTPALAVRVGIFLTVGLILLVGLSLQVSRNRSGVDTYKIVAYFNDAQGVDIGSDVSLRGVKIGRVRAIDFEPTKSKVRCELAIESRYLLPEDSVATVNSSALLGNTMVSIDFGKAPKLIAAGGEIKTRDTASIGELVQKVSDASGEAKKLIESFNSNQGDVLSKIKDVIDENRADIRTASQSMADAGPRLKELSERLNKLTEGVQKGEGTMGKLFTDSELYDSVKNFSTDARQIATDIRSGQGTLSKLIYDDGIAKQADSAFGKLGSAADDIKKAVGDNKEKFQKLMDSLGDAAPQIKESLANLEAISKKINSGEGTLGKLVNDPTLYNDTKRAVNQVGESFEGGEEQGVIRSFVGLLFGALI